jgi:hypothetical protein
MPNTNLECVEHVWHLRGVAVDPDGSLENHECISCGAVIVTRAETQTAAPPATTAGTTAGDVASRLQAHLDATRWLLSGIPKEQPMSEQTR